MESIFYTIKKSLGVDDEYEGFDTEIMLNINTALMALHQLGIGPENGLVITGVTETWTTLLAGFTNVEMAKSYVLLKTRILFDPPNYSYFVDSLTKQIQEIEWRLMVQADPPYTEPVV